MKISDVHAYLKEASQFKFEDGRYSAIFLTGKFDGVFDYNAGILDVNIYPPSHGHSNGLLSISTIDDGVWTAEPVGGIIIDEETMISIIDLFNSFKGILPEECDINDELMKLGLYGHFTG